MAFTNLYYKRAVGTPRACYICYKPTTTVLATINTVDFVYTCDAHLTDPGFATRVDDAPQAADKAAAVSPEEIARVKEEWEERQKRKKEKAKEEKKDEKDKDGKDGEKDSKDKDKKDGDAKKATSPSKSPSPPTAGTGTSTPTGTHQKYALHRDIYALRQAEHRKRRQTAQAQALAPRLPGAPRSPLPPS